MTADRFITILENSKNKLLVGEAGSFVDWSKLSHTKAHLELFLRHNIAVIYAELKDGKGEEVLVSSNPAYLSYVNGQRVQKNKNKIVKIATSPKFGRILKSSNKNIVRTWNLITNKPCEIPMGATWAIQRYIGIDDKNSEAMAIATGEILERGKLVK